MIWSRQTGFTGNSRTSSTTGWLERRLTLEGVDLVRSGAIRLADWSLRRKYRRAHGRTPPRKPYVSRYAVCAAWTQETMCLLPQRTQDLLRGHTDEQAVQIGEAYFFWLRGERGVACPEITIEEARALDRSSSRLGSNEAKPPGLYYDIKARDVSSIRVIPLLPDGEANPCCPESAP